MKSYASYPSLFDSSRFFLSAPSTSTSKLHYNQPLQSQTGYRSRSNISIMLSTRVLSRSLLRSARPKSTTFFTPRRMITTESIPASSADSILAAQRLVRPVSPHLTIYQPQLTWYLSMTTRITGVALSGVFYLYAIGYVLVSPFGVDMSVANASKKWGEFNGAVKAAVKAPLAACFSFHFWNGIRHLVWDTGRELTVRGVYRTGYGVLGLTALSTLGLLVV
ncbi:cytochrome b subunit of succinate dehydrogenase, Sdh3p [Orbilia oligospora]|nr:cytochrome b subunit of succinate dehydrogenase, Sdh3p [Orbilia oligospora]